MKESIDIEKASMNDMGRVAEIIRSSASWYEPFLAEKDYDQHYVDEKWAEDNFKKRNFFVGKKDDGKIVGTVTTQYFGKDTYLGYVYLDAEETGKGFGK
ncbi:GNAT family N-acetyltransferase, partial [Bacteriovorax sp. DB6_IX]|uniref:GNAT family N-acetyltransferase n=1 Tax=Bacteriovorax sp. DB6_IX TaxID=1353530 RepID=UPI000389E438